jgi:hypothetical protein
MESLEEQLKTVISKYKDLQQRYSSLSAQCFVGMPFKREGKKGNGQEP